MFKFLVDAKTMTSSKITGRNTKKNLLQASIQMKPTNHEVMKLYKTKAYFIHKPILHHKF